MFGLTALVAVAAMALVGASSAMASESTALCKVNEEVCASGNQVKAIHMVTVGEPLLHTNILDVRCLSSLAQATVGALGTAPTAQVATVTSLTWTGCGQGENKTHNCEVTTLKNPTFDVLRTAPNKGTAIALNAEVLVLCSGFLHCVYGGKEVKPFTIEGSSATAGNGMFTATKLSIPVVSGFLCPSTSEWTALYEPLEKIFGAK